MDAFNFDRLRELIPKEIPRIPSWPANLSHRSMNPDDEVEEQQPEPPIRLSTTSPPPSRGSKGKAAMSPPVLVPAEPEPIHTGPRTTLDLINDCDNFPTYHVSPKAYFAHINTYYALYVAEFPDTELGYMLPSVAAVFRGLPDWKLDEETRSLILVTGNTEQERSKVVAATCNAMRATGHFRILNGWRNELYPVYGPNRELLFSVERAASALFGIVTYGCHMTAYTRTPAASPDEQPTLRTWVPRRSATKQTYPGLLDNTVAGGIATGETPFSSLVRECEEEASLPASLVRARAKPAGTVTYFHIRDSRAGGETRLLQPECQYVYDLELDEETVPKPGDEEVEGFELMSVEEVKAAMEQGEFKPNCALVLVDFFIRHGILGPEELEGYAEVVARLHRRLEFPTV